MKAAAAMALALSGCAMELDVPKVPLSADCCRVIDTSADAGCVLREVPYTAPPFSEPWIDEAKVCRDSGYRPRDEP